MSLHAVEAFEGEILVDGDIVAARWVIEGQLGSGGHATVFLSRHIDLGHRAAIKVLHLDRCGSAVDEMVDRFTREARIAARVRHPNVVHVHDYGDLPDGSPYFVMDLVLGEDLQERLDRDGQLEISAAVDLGLQTLAGLDALYRAGVVHRDVKPGNLMLEHGADGAAHIKLVDFGIARVAEQGKRRLTVDGTVLGTPEYMSPEQIRGLELDVRSDLYALGVVLYECLTGALPISGKGPCATLAMALTQEPAPIVSRRPEVPEGVAEVVMRALAKDREDRWESPAAMFFALDAAARSAGLVRGALAWSNPSGGPRPPADPKAVSGRRPAARAKHRTPARETGAPRTRQSAARGQRAIGTERVGTGLSQWSWTAFGVLLSIVGTILTVAGMRAYALLGLHP
jgi:eukaryotic-like serine/threonine-protein kinase